MEDDVYDYTIAGDAASASASHTLESQFNRIGNQSFYRALDFIISPLHT